MEMTTVKLSTKNRDRIAKLGKFGDSFDDIITRILDKTEANKN